MPLVSVVICTFNPRSDYLRATVKSLEQQSLSKNQWELVIVDNSSLNGVPEEIYSEFSSHLQIRMVREEKQGLVFARIRGINETTGDLLVFVDDDNELDNTYLEKALSISLYERGVGAFGGISIGVYEKEIPDYLKKVDRFLAVRDYGQNPVTKFRDEWGIWEPFGAGMVVRRKVANRFLQEFERIQLGSLLGRKGTTLSSGEDSFLARCAYLEGYFCSYQPRLRLRHLISKERVKFIYLCRLVCGQGRAHVIMGKVRGVNNEIGRRDLIARFFQYVRDYGLAGFVEWFWYLGRYRQTRELKLSENN